MNDPRHRAPFAHHSSAVDLRGAYGASPPRFAWPPLPNAGDVVGGVPGANGSGNVNIGGSGNLNLNMGGIGTMNGNGNPLAHHHSHSHLAPSGVLGGPGYFGGASGSMNGSANGLAATAMSRMASAASAASNILGGLRMERKTSDTEYNAFEPVSTGHGHGHGHGRRMSVSDSLSSALPSVSTLRFVVLCTLWYACSAVSSNTGKVILNNFKFPVTLTIVQFFFVAGLCWVGSRRQLNWTARLRKPSRQILMHTLPMAAFQVGGHIFGSLAISRVPVSTVHTIKALSPLFTVLAYALLFGVSYSGSTYLSLLPLTLGVMLACSFDVSLSNVLGLVCAFGSTLIFVSQNIFFKKVMPSPGNAATTDGPRLDKVNLLYFSSGMAFLLMIPIWIYADATRFVSMWFAGISPATPNSTASVSTVLVYFFINGTVHFFQNVLAFAILSSTSPVTYSIASLVKRIAVICLAIVWFKQSVHAVQAVGIMLTALGLWMYNNAKRDVDKGEKKFRQVEAAREAARDGVLPTSLAHARLIDGRDSPDIYNMANFEKAKSSPVPRPYDVYGSVSKASALRHPPPQFAPPRKHQQVPVNAEPYPSPPTSAASSPPFAPSHLADEPRSPVALTALAA